MTSEPNQGVNMEIPSQMASEELQRALAGRFSLQRELGRGGMGIVFLAQDVILNRPVAIKLLAPAMCEVPALRAQFLREAHLAAACFHPHIVPVYEVGESEKQAWYVMAWVQGETLADRLLRLRTLPATQVQRIAREIGWALAYAHERGLVHRDIKPANILLEEGSGRAMLVDFGIALSTEQGEQNRGAGTAQFMAPEQLAGLSVDGRTDLYSLGVTLHLAATGRFPNTAASHTAADHADAGHAAPSPSGALRLSSRLPLTLSNAISRCLAPDPLNRFDSATAFLKEIASEESPAILSAAAVPVRDNYRNTLSLAGWAAVIGITGLALATGEEAHSFARSLIMQVSLLIASITASMSALRGIETIAGIRRAVREGLSKRELERALTPPTAGEIENPSENGKAMFPPWAKSCLLLSTAVAVAMLQAPIGSWQSVPDSLQAVLQVIAVALPAVLIHRGFKTIIETTARSKRFGIGVAKRLASSLHRWFAPGTGTYTNETLSGEALSVQEMENAPTEIRLGEANAALINRLAPDTTLALPNLRDAAVQLTRYATQLRNRERELAGLAGVTDQRAQIRSRMTTVIAALETMRLDLLRVEHQKTLSVGLTDPFETVKHLQRYVDAMDEIRRSIAQPSLP